MDVWSLKVLFYEVFVSCLEELCDVRLPPARDPAKKKQKRRNFTASVEILSTKGIKSKKMVKNTGDKKKTKKKTPKYEEDLFLEVITSSFSISI